MNQLNNEIPDHINEQFLKQFGQFPSQTTVSVIKKEGVDTLIKKNEILWYKRQIHQGVEIYDEGVVGYGTNRMYIYFKRSEGALSYKLTILTVGTKDDNTLLMLINGLKPYFNII
jgi:hypothetical protein